MEELTFLFICLRPSRLSDCPKGKIIIHTFVKCKYQIWDILTLILCKRNLLKWISKAPYDVLKKYNGVPSKNGKISTTSHFSYNDGDSRKLKYDHDILDQPLMFLLKTICCIQGLGLNSEKHNKSVKNVEMSTSIIMIRLIVLQCKLILSNSAYTLGLWCYSMLL